MKVTSTQHKRKQLRWKRSFTKQRFRSLAFRGLDALDHNDLERAITLLKHSYSLEQNSIIQCALGDALMRNGQIEQGRKLLEHLMLSDRCCADTYILIPFDSSCRTKPVLFEISHYGTELLLRYYATHFKTKPRLKYVRKCIVCIEHFLKINPFPDLSDSDSDSDEELLIKLFQVTRYHYWCNQSKEALPYLRQYSKLLKSNCTRRGFDKHRCRLSFWLLVQLDEFATLNELLTQQRSLLENGNKCTCGSQAYTVPSHLIWAKTMLF